MNNTACKNIILKLAEWCKHSVGIFTAFTALALFINVTPLMAVDDGDREYTETGVRDSLKSAAGQKIGIGSEWLTTVSYILDVKNNGAYSLDSVKLESTCYDPSNPAITISASKENGTNVNNKDGHNFAGGPWVSSWRVTRAIRTKNSNDDRFICGRHKVTVKALWGETESTEFGSIPTYIDMAGTTGNVKFNKNEFSSYTETGMGEVVSLRSAHGKYAVAESNGGMNANRTAIRHWEKFTLISHPNSGGKVSLLSATHGEYASAQPDGSLHADRDAIGPWEKFTRIDNSDGTVSFRSSHGKYLVAESNGDMNANRTAIGPWEKFRMFSSMSTPNWYQGDGGTYSLNRDQAIAKCAAHNSRLCYKSELEGRSRCAAGHLQDWVGYWMADVDPNCGNGVGYHDWDLNWSDGLAGVYCCQGL